jgi:diacylglycerol kinase (ATP)
MHVAAIVNPGSGTAAPDVVEAAIRERFGADVQVHRLAEGDDPRALARAIVETPLDLVIASGGDGTVSAVASAVVGTPTQLAIVPSGTANVLARELGIPFEIEAACDVAAKGAIKTIDVMGLADGVAMCRVAFGIMGEVGQETTSAAKQRFRGLAYAWNALPRLIDCPARLFELEIDGRTLATRASAIIVTNVGLVGWGDMRWGPTVVADDGRLDVLAVHTRTMSENLRILWDAVSGDVAGSEDVSHFRASSVVKVKSSPDVAVVADGEPVPAGDVEIRVRPRSLQVRVPRP